MISLERLRKLAPEFAYLSEEEVLAFQNAFYKAAQLAFEAYWEEKYDSENHTRLFPNARESSTLSSWTLNDKKPE